jgi:ABC-type dipeptide/oligopeptide/nickel transport system permease subunit
VGRRLPGVAIVATVLSVNTIGERFRDLLDPRLRGL